MSTIYQVTDMHNGATAIVTDASSPAQAIRAIIKDRFEVKPLKAKDMLECLTKRDRPLIVSAKEMEGEKAPTSAEPSSTEPAPYIEPNRHQAEPTAKFPWVERAAHATA